MAKNREQCHCKIFVVYSMLIRGGGLFAFACDKCVKAFKCKVCSKRQQHLTGKLYLSRHIHTHQNSYTRVYYSLLSSFELFCGMVFFFYWWMIHWEHILFQSDYNNREIHSRILFFHCSFDCPIFVFLNVKSHPHNQHPCHGLTCTFKIVILWCKTKWIRVSFY